MSDAANRPKPPEDLADESLLEWHRVCDDLESLGTLQTSDRALLVLYVGTWAIHQAAMRHVDKHGSIVKWPNGTAGPSPQYKTSRECAAQLRALLADLGITPINRAKVKPPAEKKPAETDGGY